MLITNLNAFFVVKHSFLFFKPPKLSHLNILTTDGAGWTTEKPRMCCGLGTLIWDYGLHGALIILSQLPVHQKSQQWLLTLTDWCTPTALRWAVVALHLSALMNRIAQLLLPHRPWSVWSCRLQGLGFIACHFFSHLLKSLFTHSDFCGPYLGLCVHLQKPWTAKERVDLCISERIHMPEGEEGLYYMLYDGGNNISSNWWDEDIRELLAAWHDTCCQIKMRPGVHLSASIYHNNAFTPRLHFSPICITSTFCECVWCGPFSASALSDVKKLKYERGGCWKVIQFILLNWSVCPFLII